MPGAVAAESVAAAASPAVVAGAGRAGRAATGGGADVAGGMMEGMDSADILRDPVPDGSTLTGQLLVATPEISAGVFHRAVVLVLHHDEDGAQGVVLNKYVDADLDEVLPGWDEHTSCPGGIFQGGPVKLDSAVGLVALPGDDDPVLGTKRLFGGVGLVDLDAPPVLISPEVAGLRVFVGYAGWSAGQLESEIDEGGWFVVPARVGDAFTADPPTLWTRVLRRQPPPLCLAATLPDDPTMN